MKANLETFGSLRWFKPSEFRHPFKMDAEFVMWLDRVRDLAGVPFVITSDFRDFVPVGGYSQSLHMVGRAVDIRYPWLGPNFTDGRRLARITEAVVKAHRPRNCGYEFGIEHGAPAGAHLHIGLYGPEKPDPYVFAR